MKSIARYYKSLSDKEQFALNILAAVLAPLLLYFLLVNPSLSYYLSAKQEYAYNHDLVTWIGENESKVTLKPKTLKNESDKPLLQTISASAEAGGIKLSRLQPESSTQVRIWLNDTEFAVLAHWLSKLIQQSGLTIASISIDKTSKPGIVNAQCLLAKN